VDTIRSSAAATKADVLETLYIENMYILTASTEAVSRYTGTAIALGIPTAGFVVEVADRQRMLTQKMAKEALFIGANIHKSEILNELSNTMSLFEDSHRDIVQGLAASQRCRNYLRCAPSQK